MHHAGRGLSRVLRRNPVKMRDGRLEIGQPDARHSSAQVGRVSTPGIVRSAFSIALPNAPRFATSLGDYWRLTMAILRIHACPVLGAGHHPLQTVSEKTRSGNASTRSRQAWLRHSNTLTKCCANDFFTTNFVKAVGFADASTGNRNELAQVAFVKLQLRRLGKGRELKPDVSPLLASIRQQIITKRCTPGFIAFGCHSHASSRPARDIVRGRTSRGLGFPC